MTAFIYLVFIATVTTIFWDQSFFLPVKYLCVLLHEFCHGIFSLLSGGFIQEVHIDSNEGGETIVDNLHNSFLVLFIISSGYLGSAFVGAIFIRRGLAKTYHKITVLFIAIIFIFMTKVFTKNYDLAFKVGMGWGIAFFFVGVMGKSFAKYFLLTIGTVLIWYAFFDLLDFTDLNGQTDALILSNYIKKENWIYFSNMQTKELVSLISIFWSILVVLIVLKILYPAFNNTNYTLNEHDVVTYKKSAL